MMNLADPELELLDPTPNVHYMFFHFDKTFFWGQLGNRCRIRWSKRMYSCAGICSYQWRQGFCDIALSEPLLKLRPRKDLVETMLHEMIHAYLFVTNQDQDRDGHGPNFQAHMHRINRAAGLQISIYHDFHDEVESYQTHWWRCNGLCQLYKPYFGIVRRSMNRPPGPSDFWWYTHQRTCGGTFIKIKEPTKPTNKGKKDNVAKPNGDITKYINNNNNETVNKDVTQKDTPKSVLKDTSNLIDIIKATNNSINSYIASKKTMIFNNQVPFDLNTAKLKVIHTKTNFNVNGRRISIVQKHKTSNGKNPRLRIIIRKKNNDNNNTTPEDVIEMVRKVWADKQMSANNKNQIVNNNIPAIEPAQNEQKPNYQIVSPPSQQKKIDDFFSTKAITVLKELYGQDLILKTEENEKIKAIPVKYNSVECPVCKHMIDTNEINKHLDECLNKDIIEKLSREDYPKEGNQENIQTIDLTNTELNTNSNQKRSRPSIHDGEFFDIMGAICENASKLRKSDYSNLPSTHYVSDDHLLDNQPIIIDPPTAVEPGCSKSDFDQKCPCCNVKLNKSMNEHLEECLSFFKNNTTVPEEGASKTTSKRTIFVDDTEDDLFDESQIFNDTGSKVPCPHCLKMIEELDMNAHLDACLYL